MFQCGFLLFLISTCVATGTSDSRFVQPREFEDIINATIEGLRGNISDPFEIESLHIDLPNDGFLNGTVGISSFSLSGLRDFHLTQLSLNTTSWELKFMFMFVEQHLFTDFALDTVLINTIPLYGDGNLTINIFDLEILVSTHIQLTDQILLDNLNVQIYLGTATSLEIHGINNDPLLDEIITTYLSLNLGNLIDDNSISISNLISPIIQDLINNALGPQVKTILRNLQDNN